MYNVVNAQTLQIVALKNDPNDFLKCVFDLKKKNKLRIIPALWIIFIWKTVDKIFSPRAFQKG